MAEGNSDVPHFQC